ncbi:hypothetical protein DVS28_b0411 (plasmid) [Euzebya pacifica]|uniref:Uncharacterized protein n=1 Tax=Euzebya pacifica TaxID=1608957 RepID=A0A346Y6R7_9ACTN|nr:hypothetical protein DVS28_b0411 [Euzebya pacifica]
MSIADGTAGGNRRTPSISTRRFEDAGTPDRIIELAIGRHGNDA